MTVFVPEKFPARIAIVGRLRSPFAPEFDNAVPAVVRWRVLSTLPK